MLTSASDSDGMNPSGQTPPTRAHAALARDAALARVGHARRWVILGSAGLTAGFAALVAASPPSHASTTKATTTSTAPIRTATVTRKGQAPALPPLASGSQLGLQGPSQNPGSGDDGSQAAAPQAQVAPTQQQSQSAAVQPAPSPQPAPVSGGS
jgi:hypothetical protein